MVVFSSIYIVASVRRSQFIQLPDRSAFMRAAPEVNILERCVNLNLVSVI